MAMNEYPKMLYLGPYRMPVTVQTAAEEARFVAAYAEPKPEPEHHAKPGPEHHVSEHSGRRGGVHVK